MKTKKEIFYEHARKKGNYYISGQLEWMLDAMEEYAEQAAKNLQKAPVSGSVCECDYIQTTAGWQCKKCGKVMTKFC
jgi:rubrerythrin